MTIQLEVTQNDIVILDTITALILNNRERLGKDYVRALDLMKSAKKQTDSIKANQYERKLNGSTLIYDAK